MFKTATHYRDGAPALLARVEDVTSGTIRVEDNVPRGARFVVELPA